MTPRELDPSFSVLVPAEPVTPAALEQARALGVSEKSLAWIESLASAELMHTSGLDVSLWAPSRLMEMNAAYAIRERIPRGVGVGAAGSHFLVEVDGALYAAGPGALAMEDMTWLAEHIDEFLGSGRGPELTW